MLKLWLISQEVNTGWDTYDSAVVAAEDEAGARMMHPSDYMKDWDGTTEKDFGSWCAVGQVKVVLIGEANDELPPGVVCSSFNAG